MELATMTKKGYLSFNDLISLTGLELKHFRFYRHIESSDPECGAYNLFQKWAEGNSEFEDYQNSQGSKNIFGEDYLASFIQTLSDETIFVGIYKKHGQAINNGVHVYDFKKTDHLKELCGRVVTDWPKDRSQNRVPDSFEAKILLIKGQENDKEFPGFLNFIYEVDKIKSIPPKWKEYLSHTKGVYLLTCTNDRKHQYVGKASGVDGFYGRWMNYTKPEEGEVGDGGNKLLIEHNKNSCGAFEVTILEVTSWADTKIYEKEQAWMRKLRTKQDSGGLNAN